MQLKRSVCSRCCRYSSSIYLSLPVLRWFWHAPAISSTRKDEEEKNSEKKVTRIFFSLCFCWHFISNTNRTDVTMSTISITDDVQHYVKYWRNSLRYSSSSLSSCCFSIQTGRHQTSSIRTTACLINIKFTSTHANDSITRKNDRKYLSVSLFVSIYEENESVEIECWWRQAIRSINRNSNGIIYPWEGKHHWWK